DVALTGRGLLVVLRALGERGRGRDVERVALARAEVDRVAGQILRRAVADSTVRGHVAGRAGVDRPGHTGSRAGRQRIVQGDVLGCSGTGVGDGDREADGLAGV